MSRTEFDLQNKRWVVKLGSALLTRNGTTLDAGFIAALADQVAALRADGNEVVLVSSGAVAAGMSQLQLTQRPAQIEQLQAVAAVGQAALIRQYQDTFAPHDIKVAQVLLTHADIANRSRYLNARATLRNLLDLGVMAIINENDSVATEEICFGDNDNLAALVANLLDADVLVILTDQDGLYTADPRSDSSATLVSEAAADDESLVSMASSGSSLGRGGMVTKLTAARKAGRSGAATIIAHGATPQVLTRLAAGEDIGTLLRASQRMRSKKQWLAGQMRSSGKLVLDDGAVQVLKQHGRSLLAIGVLAVQGEFGRGELVSCVDQAGAEIARGLINYSSDEAELLAGKNSDAFVDILGHPGADELIHRDNLVLS